MAAQLPYNAKSKPRDLAMRTDPRVSFVMRPEDTLVQCAYDQSHYVLPTKLTSHLTKCRHNYLNANKKKKQEPGTEILVCRFSFFHHLPASEIEEHEKTCPDGIKQAEEEDQYDFAFQRRMADFQIPMPKLVEQDTSKIRGLQKEKNFKNAFDAAQYEDNKNLNKRKEVLEWDSANNAKAENPKEDELTTKNKNQRYTSYDPQYKVQQNKHDLILNPQGLTASERRNFRERLEDGRLEEDEEMPEIRPRFVPASSRDFRPSVGFPGWEVQHGDRRDLNHRVLKK